MQLEVVIVASDFLNKHVYLLRNLRLIFQLLYLLKHLPPLTLLLSAKVYYFRCLADPLAILVAALHSLPARLLKPSFLLD
jgi:hypothetical protein